MLNVTSEPCEPFDSCEGGGVGELIRDAACAAQNNNNAQHERAKCFAYVNFLDK